MNHWKTLIKSLYVLTILATAKLFLAFIKLAKNDNRILIIKLDAIGDYVLFRNFIKELKENSKYRNHKITLVGNKAVKGLAEWLDSKEVDEFIWIDKKKIYKRPKYLFSVFKILHKRFSLVVQPTFSREFISDVFVNITKSSSKVGLAGDTNNILPLFKKFSDKFYSKLVNIPPEIAFEFDKNKILFEDILQTSLAIKTPQIIIPAAEIAPFEEEKQYAVLFPGASHFSRQWAADNFTAIAAYINDNYNFDLIVAGVIDDIAMAERIIALLPEKNITNLMGKTDLKGLTLLLAGAKLLISNDTGAAHIGTALNTKTIVVSRYNHYRRFFPYPDQTLSSSICITPILSPALSEEELQSRFALGSDIDINLITVEQVKEAVKKSLS